MQNTKQRLHKRRNIALIVLLFIALLSIIVDRYFPFSPPSYIDTKYHILLVYFLIAYKVIELGIFYMLFYKKHYLKTLAQEYHITSLEKFEKQAKKFFFLVPQGSIVFGILSYKLSGNVQYLWLFLAIAAMVLWRVNPKKLT
ncbi:MAG TPA: hypothetical protein ENK98_07530 [Epsilonproteobacteria bacterium]|nr:hypothetical protein [Campylobacterota bacterium]